MDNTPDVNNCNFSMCSNDLVQESSANQVDLLYVTVLTLPSPNPISNTGFVSYTYTVDPSIVNGVSANTTSNTVTTKINQASIDYSSNQGLVKSVDMAYAKVGDVLTYTIVLKNTGNVSAENISLLDTIPSGTSLVNNSVVLNGSTVPGANPGAGVNVGTISAGAMSTLTFKVTVTTIPTVNPIPNNATVSFYYIVDPSAARATGQGYSNQVVTQVNQATIPVLTKSVNNLYAKIGDTLTYTVVFKSTGNVSATSVIFTDTIPLGTTFVNDSLTLNGLQQTGVNPQSGLNIGTIVAGVINTVTFQVIVNTIPTINPILNNSEISYKYIVNPSSAAIGEIATSNQVSTKVNQAIINGAGFVKAVDKAYALIGDILTYTIALTNTGNTTAFNIVFSDTTPNGTSFITNSLSVNGTPLLGITPIPPGFNLGTLVAGSITTVSYKVSVTSIPSPNPIPNSSNVTFRYRVDPVGAFVQDSGNTNIVTTTVSQALIDYSTGGLTKSVDTPYAKINDVLTYSIILKNTGNTTATSVVLFDTIPDVTSFVLNSVYVDNSQVPGADPASGINIADIGPGFISTVNFKVTVTTIPTANLISNVANVAYEYVNNPASTPISTTGISNSAITTINEATIVNPIKVVDKPYAKIGDVLTYSFALINSGNTTAINVVLKDTIPAGTNFVSNSVKINGVTTIANPQTGITVGNIGKRSQITVTFQVVVNTIPTINPIPNDSTTSYNFIVNPLSTPISRTINSNTVLTQINQAIINDNNLVKSVDSWFGQVGDVLTYTIGISNTGNVTANSVIIRDTIPTATAFINNSVTIDGVSIPGAVPSSGILVGTIVNGTTSTVTFQVSIVTIPSPNIIKNSATAYYQYIVNPSEASQNDTSNSNIVKTQVSDANLNGGVKKYVNTKYALLGDTLHYTLGIANKGNLTANSVILIDTVPVETSYVPNTVALNGVNIPGADPSLGVSVGTIAASGLSTVTFDATIISLPSSGEIINSGLVTFEFIIEQQTGVNATSLSIEALEENPSIIDSDTFVLDAINGIKSNEIVALATTPTIIISSYEFSNPVIVIVNQAIINSGTLVKLADKDFVIVGDTITYSIVIKNTGNTTANNLIVLDTIPIATTFIPNSLSVNGSIQLGKSPQPPSGANIGSLAVGSQVTVSYQVIVNTIPSTGNIKNSATLGYQYTSDPSLPPITSSISSGIVVSTISQAIIDASSFIKTTNPPYSTLGDTITYTLSVGNRGNTTAINVVVVDTIPSVLTFNTGSIEVDGVQIGGTPSGGINVGSIGPGAIATITFTAVVTTLPLSNPVGNIAYVGYDYELDPGAQNLMSGSNTSNISNTTILYADILAPSQFVKSVDKGYATKGDVIVYSMVITNTGNTTAANVVIVDTIPVETSFMPNSVVINGNLTSFNPNTGIVIPAIAAKSSAFVQFTVIASSIPAVNPLVNNASLGYSFTVNPTIPTIINGNNISNSVYTTVTAADIVSLNNFTKSAAPVSAVVGTTITYTLVARNTGNITATNVIIYDTIPAATTFVGGTVQINGAGSGDDPSTGIHVSTVGPQSTTTITFDVVLTTISSINPIPNVANLIYDFSPTGTNETIVTSTSSNVSNIVALPTITMTKTPNTDYAIPGDTVTYTIVVKNPNNIVIDNAVVNDLLAPQLSFIAGTVTINGVADITQNILTGVNTGSIPANGTTTIQFSAKVVSTDETPISNVSNLRYFFNGPYTSDIYSNLSTINVNVYNTTITKTSSLTTVTMGVTIPYTVVFSNLSNHDIYNVKFTDFLPNGVSLLTTTFMVDGNPLPINSLQDFINGVNIGTVTANGTTTITFSVKSTRDCPLVINSALFMYNYLLPNNVGGTLTSAIATNTIIRSMSCVVRKNI